MKNKDFHKGLKRAPHWTNLYYRVLEHYFWRPQTIGRINHPAHVGKNWNFWEAKLANQEAPLNHILDFLFHVAPQELLDQIASTFLDKSVTGLQLMSTDEKIVDGNIVQPDIVLTNGKNLVFIEIKVDSRSSIDQFVKYTIAAERVIQSGSRVTSVDLVLLVRHADYKRVWKKVKGDHLLGPQSVRSLALQGVRGDDSVWSQRGVQRFMRKHPDAIESVADLIQSIGIHLRDYGVLESALLDYASKEPTVGRLIDGVVYELERRALIMQRSDVG